jgi:hypothetical protein
MKKKKSALFSSSFLLVRFRFFIGTGKFAVVIFPGTLQDEILEI